MKQPPHTPQASRARDALLRSIDIAADSGGWASWADVRQTFRETYRVEPRRAATPEREAKARKRAIARAWRAIADHVDVDRRPLGDRVRLRPGFRP